MRDYQLCNTLSLIVGQTYHYETESAMIFATNGATHKVYIEPFSSDVVTYINVDYQEP